MKNLFLLVAVLGAGVIAPPLCAQPSNTIVRFHITAGIAVVGDIDVELFNSEKPVTVRNFLRYMETGAYQNVFLHACLPGIAVQGGGYQTINPLDTGLFLNAFFSFRGARNLGETYSDPTRSGGDLNEC